MGSSLTAPFFEEQSLNSPCGMTSNTSHHQLPLNQELEELTLTPCKVLGSSVPFYSTYEEPEKKTRRQVKSDIRTSLLQLAFISQLTPFATVTKFSHSHIFISTAFPVLTSQVTWEGLCLECSPRSSHWPTPLLSHPSDIGLLL